MKIINIRIKERQAESIKRERPAKKKKNPRIFIASG